MPPKMTAQVSRPAARPTAREGSRGETLQKSRQGREAAGGPGDDGGRRLGNGVCLDAAADPKGGKYAEDGKEDGQGF